MTRMRHVARRLAPVGAVAATATAIAVLVPPTSSPVVPPADGTVSVGLLRASAETAPTRTFGVRVGALTELYPGARASLPVGFDNPFAVGIKVVSYAATAALANTPRLSRCRSTDLVVPSGTVTLHRPRIVRPGGTNDLTIPVTLSRKAPPACQHVVFTVTVTATAVTR